MTTPRAKFLVSQTDDEDDVSPSTKKSLKRKRVDSNTETDPPTPAITIPSSSPLYRHFAHVCAVNMNETILENAEICGTNLAVKLMQMGANSILEEIREQLPIIPSQ